MNTLCAMRFRRLGIAAFVIAAQMAVSASAAGQELERSEPTTQAVRFEIRRLMTQLSVISEFFMRDSATGFMIGLDGSQRAAYGTIDGGASWSRLAAPVPIPHHRVLDGRLISSDGRESIDDGRTWRPFVTVSNSDEPPHHDSIVRVEPGDGTVMAALYLQAFEDSVVFLRDDASPPSSHRIPRGPGPLRIAISIDGGTSWQPLDSISTRDTIRTSMPVPSVLLEESSGALGAIPLRDVQDHVRHAHEWIRFAPARRAALAVLRVDYINLSTLRRIQKYLLVTLFGDSSAPRWEQIEAPPLGILSASDGRIVRWDSKRVYISSGPGGEWDTAATVPPNVDGASLQFLTPECAFTRSHRTTNGGRTWIRFPNPFDDAEFVVAVDSLHLFAAGTARLFAASSDAGESWRRISGFVPHVAAASNDRIVAAGMNRVVLVSPDRGDTWSDAGEDARHLPTGLSWIHTLAFVDGTDTVFGVASLNTTSGRSLAAVVSTDGGLTWALRGAIPASLPSSLTAFLAVGRADSRIIWYASDAGLFASNDAGHTWTRKDSVAATAIEVFDEDNVIVAVELNGLEIRRTSTGGRSWSLAFRAREMYDVPLALRAFGAGHVRMLLRHRFQRRSFLLARSYDGGRGWQIASGADTPFPLTSVRWVDSANAVMIGSAGEVAISSDGGLSFVMHEQASGSFDGSPLFSAAIAIDGGTAYGLYTTSGFRLLVDDSVGSVQNEIAPGRNQFTIVPNPSRGEPITLVGGVPDDDTRITFMDILGRPRRAIETRTARTGVSVSDLTAGAYFVRVQTRSAIEIVPFLLISGSH